MKDYNTNQVCFTDENFGLVPKEFQEICTVKVEI